MEKAFAVQLSQDKVGVGGAGAGLGRGLRRLTRASCPGVLHLHGGGAAEGQPLGAPLRDPVLLLPHLLSGLHPEVALHPELQQQDHQVSPDPGPAQLPGLPAVLTGSGGGAGRLSPRSCPECRVASEFVIPSVYWVEKQEDKDHLIDVFKSGVR